MTTIGASCDQCDYVQFEDTDCVIDDEYGVYLFTCPQCGAGVSKRMDQKIRDLLRGGGVATVDEKVESGSVELESDADIWRAVLS